MTINLKITPAPWVVEPGPKGDPDVHDADFYVSNMNPAGDVVAVIPGPVSIGSTEANARLIAAAPDLYAACEKALERCGCSVAERESGHRVDCVASDLDYALAKARGKA